MFTVENVKIMIDDTINHYLICNSSFIFLGTITRRIDELTVAWQRGNYMSLEGEIFLIFRRSETWQQLIRSHPMLCTKTT